MPHRQVVFTVPKRLRIFFRYDSKLLGELASCAWRALRPKGFVADLARIRDRLTMAAAGLGQLGEVGLELRARYWLATALRRP